LLGMILFIIRQILSREADIQTGRQVGRQIGRKADKQTDR